MSEAGARILLVDDNPANLRVLYEALQGAGYRLSLAPNGETALDIARQVRPDLVLLDITMPGMDGLEVCRRLRQETDTRQAAIIFLTARTDSAAKVSGLDLGAVDYITKPIFLDEVLARVRTHLTIRQLNMELERRVAERTAQLLHADRLATLGALTAGLLHELRNPLVTLAGYHRLMRKALDEAVAQQPASEALSHVSGRLSTAQDAATRIIELMENMLGFARKESRPGAVDLAAVADEAMRMLAGLDGRVRVRLSGPPLKVHGSAVELLQVLMNLMRNSAEALHDHASPEIVMEWWAAGAQAVIKVRDNGPGIPAQFRDHLFRPFFTTKDRKGTGLGLMISRQIVEEMAGSISYTDTSGGACFEIRLPLSDEAVSGRS
jgi:signal transduction histidine kinase